MSMNHERNPTPTLSSNFYPNIELLAKSSNDWSPNLGATVVLLGH